LALMNMDTSTRKLPGYVNALVDPNDTSVGRRASWVVMAFPFMEQSALWDEWSGDFDDQPSAVEIEFLICPSDPPDLPGQPSLSYVCNAGMGFEDLSREGGGDVPANYIAPNPSDRELAGNGVFFDNARNMDIISGAARDMREDYPPITSSIQYVQANDGTSKTLMLSESVHTWYYAYPGDSSEQFTSGVSNDGTMDISPIEDTKHIFGFVWYNDAAGIERINGDNDYDDSNSSEPVSMVAFAERSTNRNPNAQVPSAYESYGYPSSSHPSGVNVVFVDGHILFLSDSISPRVYAQMMTSNRKRSKYFADWGSPPVPTLDKDLPPPSDSDF
jgi:prepilin-type processing-associated H-X9-DG protein